MTKPLAGLLIDEWIEVVPSASETTGMVFQFDQPDAAPPQSHPAGRAAGLGQPGTLVAAAGLARNARPGAHAPVDPDALDELGHYLPALYFALNAARRNGLDRLSPTLTEQRQKENRHALNHHLDEARAAQPQRRHDVGLQARIYDPLWLLARQWQVGEFQGEDDGSPAAGAAGGRVGRLTRYHPGRWPTNACEGQPSARTTPLETLVEREPVRPRARHAERLRCGRRRASTSCACSNSSRCRAATAPTVQQQLSVRRRSTADERAALDADSRVS